MNKFKILIELETDNVSEVLKKFALEGYEAEVVALIDPFKPVIGQYVKFTVDNENVHSEGKGFCRSIIDHGDSQLYCFEITFRVYSKLENETEDNIVADVYYDTREGWDLDSRMELLDEFKELPENPIYPIDKEVLSKNVGDMYAGKKIISTSHEISDDGAFYLIEINDGRVFESTIVRENK